MSGFAGGRLRRRLILDSAAESYYFLLLTPSLHHGTPGLFLADHRDELSKCSFLFFFSFFSLSSLFSAFLFNIPKTALNKSTTRLPGAGEGEQAFTSRVGGGEGLGWCWLGEWDGGEKRDKKGSQK
ncbi:hypothetical protein F4809DRAFT_570998 [Biscogniauxia mediterranea]|nr:hypothetical protein F4809DRAFT_570998 [Biscogniauxia mediterranea]